MEKVTDATHAANQVTCWTPQRKLGMFDHTLLRAMQPKGAAARTSAGNTKTRGSKTGSRTRHWAKPQVSHLLWVPLASKRDEQPERLRDRASQQAAFYLQRRRYPRDGLSSSEIQLLVRW
eukprot:4529318-Amphidinium_carterae.1